MTGQSLQAVQPFQQGIDFLLSSTQAYSPRLLAVAVLLLVGIVVARLSSIIVSRSLKLLGVDGLAATTEWLRLGILFAADVRPSRMAATLVKWIVLFVFVIAAVDVLGLEGLSVGLSAWLAYLPALLGGLALAFLGLWAASACRKMATGRLEAIGFEQAKLMGQVFHGLLLVLTGVLVLAQFGLETVLLHQAIVVVLASLGLTVGLAFGLGSRDFAASLIAGGYLREVFSPGDQLRVDDVAGRLRQIGAVASILETADGEVCIPNKLLISSVTKKTC